MDLGLTGKVALVTGSSRGLGLATARALAAEGCRVCICARGREALAAAAADVERSAQAAREPSSPCEADVSTASGIELVVKRTLDSFGGLDILVNNVGKATGGDIGETSDAEWQAAFDETLFPAIRASRLVVPHMKARGAGSIIMIASIWGRESGGRMTYNAVKAAEISLAKAMAQQLAPFNIRVNSVAPGSIMFPGGSWHKRQQADPEGHRGIRQARAAFRPLRPRRRSRERRHLPRLRPRQLDQRRLHHRRRLSESVEHLKSLIADR